MSEALTTERIEEMHAALSEPNIGAMVLHSRDFVDVRSAIAELLALRKRVGELEGALRPFAEVGAALTAHSPTDMSPWATAPDNTPYGNQGLVFGDFRRAAAIPTQESK